MKLNQLRNSSSDIIYRVRERLSDSIQTILNEFYPNGLDLTSDYAERLIDANELYVPSIEECSITFIGKCGYNLDPDDPTPLMEYTDLGIEDLISIYDCLCDFVEHDTGLAFPSTMAEILLDGQIEADKSSVWKFIGERYDEHKYDTCEDMRNAYLAFKNNN